MTTPAYSIVFSAVYAASEVVSIGNVIIPNSGGTAYQVATAANRGSRRSEAIALTAADGTNVTVGELQQSGTISATISGLAAGSASWVRCSSTGTIERIATPSGSDDVIGWAEADGRVHLMFGVLTPTLVTGSATASIGGVCTLEQFGAVGDGVTSDQAAWVAAMAALNAGTYKTLELGAKTYLVSGNTALTFGRSIVGQGATSVLKTTSNLPLVLVYDADAADRAKATTLADFAVEGSGKASGLGSQDGIRNGYLSGDGSSRVLISNVYAKSFGGIGIFTSYSDELGVGAVISDCRVESCAVGCLATEAELHNLQAVDNTVGLRAGGNCILIGGGFEGNTTAYEVTAGGNDAHGICIGTSWTHNTTAISIAATTNGQYFYNCRVFDGAISITNGNGLFHEFVGGHYEPTTLDGLGKARWIGVTFGASYYVSSSFTNGENEIIDPRGEDGTIPTWIGALIDPTYTFASDANQTLTAQQSAATCALDVQAGVISASRQLTSTRPPNRGQRFHIINRTAYALTYKWSTGTVVSIPSGCAAYIGADGTNAVILGIYSVTATGSGAGVFATAPTFVNGVSQSMAAGGTEDGFVLQYQGTKLRILEYVNEFQSTTASLNSPFIWTMVDGTTTRFDVVVTMKAVGSTAKAASYTGNVTAQRNGSTTAIVGAAEYGTAQETTAGDGIAWLVDDGTDTVSLGLTSADGDDRNWTMQVRIMEVTDDA